MCVYVCMGWCIHVNGRELTIDMSMRMGIYVCIHIGTETICVG